MIKKNYQRELEKLLEGLQGRPTLLLHSCCGPCSSYVLEYLNQYFAITIFYYNPQMDTEEEFEKRFREQEKIVRALDESVNIVKGAWEPEVYRELITGMEDELEGGKRCYTCYDFRMEKAAKYAQENDYDYFATTLSVSPYKNHLWINEIGEKWEQHTGVKHLPSDFKKKDGYKRSVELSKEHDLYRQSYCGCIYSKAQMAREGKL